MSKWFNYGYNGKEKWDLGKNWSKMHHFANQGLHWKKLLNSGLWLIHLGIELKRRSKIKTLNKNWNIQREKDCS